VEFSVIFDKKAAKELLKLPKDTKTRIDYRVIVDINLKEKG